MTTSKKSHFTYPQQLLEAGWKGAHAPRVESPSDAMGRMILAPVGIGAGLGALSMSLFKQRRSAISLASAAAIGSLVGLMAGAAWATRRTTGAAARSALREIKTTRDLHWLDKNPIAYG